jgi:peptidoglycan/LPS O-acetylase OafA/YrhL
MRSATPRPSLLVGALTLIIAVGVCAVASAVMVPSMLGGVGAWPVLIAGCVMLIGALVALWIIQRRRDETLR